MGNKLVNPVSFGFVEGADEFFIKAEAAARFGQTVQPITVKLDDWYELPMSDSKNKIATLPFAVDVAAGDLFEVAIRVIGMKCGPVITTYVTPLIIGEGEGGSPVAIELGGLNQNSAPGTSTYSPIPAEAVFTVTSDANYNGVASVQGGNPTRYEKNDATIPLPAKITALGVRLDMLDTTTYETNGITMTIKKLY